MRTYYPHIATARTFRIAAASPKRNINALHYMSLDCSPFVRHYLGNENTIHHLVPRKFDEQDENRVPYFLFLRLLRCFTSPAYLPAPMYSVQNNWAFPQLGFPIRTLPGQRLLVTSPRNFADCHVLLRPLLSSHPPYTLEFALRSLTTHDINVMIVSVVLLLLLLLFFYSLLICLIVKVRLLKLFG